jgi:hypothetical protein
LPPLRASSKEWVKKWLKRFREERAAGVPLEQILQGHSRARKHAPLQTHPLVVEQVLAIRDQPPEGLRRVPGKAPIRYYLERDPALSSRTRWNNVNLLVLANPLTWIFSSQRLLNF